VPDDRLIHKAFGQSEKVNRLTDFERLVWLVYKVAADDFGVMRFSAITLQDGARFLEKRPAKQVMRALESVREVELVLTFQHQDRTYCFDPVWQTWQKITHPRQTKQPIAPADRCDLNTQFLLTYHPSGGKLSSWMHPSLRTKKTGSAQEVLPVQTGSAPSVDREDTRLLVVGVDVGNGGVGDRGRGDSPAGRPARSRGLMAGSSPIEHGECLAHGPVCFRPFIAKKYLPRFGGDQAAMVTWAREVCEAWNVKADAGIRPPEGDDFAFWAARYDETYGQSNDTGAVDAQRIAEHIRKRLEEKPVRNAR
jgi:hypothetical protein